MDAIRPTLRGVCILTRVQLKNLLSDIKKTMCFRAIIEIKGMIGELLFHILMTEEQLYSPVSAFF